MRDACDIISVDKTLGKCLSRNLQTASDYVPRTAGGSVTDPDYAEASTVQGWTHP